MAIDSDEHAGRWDIKPEVRHDAQQAFNRLSATDPVADLRVLDLGSGTALLSAIRPALCSRMGLDGLTTS